MVGKIIKILQKAIHREIKEIIKIDNSGNIFVEDPENLNKPIFITPQDLNSAEKGKLSIFYSIY